MITEELHERLKAIAIEKRLLEKLFTATYFATPKKELTSEELEDIKDSQKKLCLQIAKTYHDLVGLENTEEVLQMFQLIKDFK